MIDVRTEPAAPAARTLCLCADDFGLAPGISAGIARLACAHRVTAVSCITTGPHWQEGAPMLREFPASISVGLHLNLTEGRPSSAQLARIWPRFPSLHELLLRAHLGLLPQSAIQDEIRVQLDAFKSGTGKLPQHVDGHQHIHQLPGLRDIVLDMTQRMPVPPAVRSTSPLPGPGSSFKRWVIVNSGGRALARELDRRGLAHNPALLGATDFHDEDYRAKMQGWLAALPRQGGLLFCHPGQTPDSDPIYPHANASARELAYFESDLFQVDLDAANVALGLVWQKTHTGPPG